MNFSMVFLVFSFAFLSFIYELAIAQTMVFLTADALVWYALAGGIFLGSMGLGSVWARSSGIHRSPVRFLVFLDCLQALIGGTSIILLHVTYHMTLVLGGLNSVLASGAILFVAAFLGSAAVGLLAGAGLSLFTEMESRDSASWARTPVVYYFGSLVAGFVFPVFFLPYLSAVQIVLGAGLTSVFVALYLSWTLRDEKDLRLAAISTALVVFLGMLLFQAPTIDMFFAEKYYTPVKNEASWKDFFASSGPQASLHRYHVAHQQVDFVRFPSGGEDELAQLMGAYRLRQDPSLKELGGWGLFINGVPRFSSDFEDVYYETFAHVPVGALAATPKRVLILGGDGLLARELLRIRSVRKIIVVDDVGMKRLSKKELVFKKLQKSSLKAKRVQVVEADIYDFIRRDEKVYDAIYLDSPYPLDYDGSKVFSYEFLRSVKARLAPQGFMVLAASGFFQKDDASFSGDMAMSSQMVFLATLRKAGFQTVVPFFSRLEEDNPAALAVMEKISGGEKGQAKELLQGYVSNLKSGFLLAIPRSDVILKKDFSSRIRYHILNAARFLLSLEAQDSLPKSEDGLNTIFHPQLPRPGSWWKIRFPY